MHTGPDPGFVYGVGGTERAILWEVWGHTPKKNFKLRDSNIEVQPLSSQMECEFNVIFLTIYSLLDIKVFLQASLASDSKGVWGAFSIIF